MEYDGGGALLLGDLEVEGLMPRVRGRSSDRVTGGTAPVPE